MLRVPEPEIMADPAQAKAYAEADFSEAHNRFVRLFRETFGIKRIVDRVLDLGCGPADMTMRFAESYPECLMDAVDASDAMLRLAEERVQKRGWGYRIRLAQGRLPEAELPENGYAAILSNSLLHHLQEPQALWQAVKRYGKPGAPVWVMDLLRPATPEQADALVDQYASGAPEILRRDFRHSLQAAYRPEEVLGQLESAGLNSLQVRVVSDRHFVAGGRL
jgi:ubiquinone/menaquinone biosynthesis C-methylase UbiE